MAEHGNLFSFVHYEQNNLFPLFCHGSSRHTCLLQLLLICLHTHSNYEREHTCMCVCTAIIAQYAKILAYRTSKKLCSVYDTSIIFAI